MSKKIAVLSASWHVPIVESAENSFIEAMLGKGYRREDIVIFKVPGALEVPLAGQKALENGFDAAVGIGFVVDGGIYERDFVAHTVIQSILDVSVKTGKPFISSVMTPKAFAEGSKEFEEMFVKHMVIKGQEAAECCCAMLDVLPKVEAA